MSLHSAKKSELITKYRTHETDFGALARELHSDDGDPAAMDESSDDHDEWADQAEPSRD